MELIEITDRDGDPVTTIWDALNLNPNLSLKAQLEEYSEDLLMAVFPNGVSLDVLWKSNLRPGGALVVWLRQNPDYSEHFAGCRARSVAGLKPVIARMVDVAQRRTMTYPLSGRSVGAEKIWLNDLVVDLNRPLEEQPHLFKERLFEAFIGSYGSYALTIKWSPPHDPRGEFLIELRRIPYQWRYPSADLIRVETIYKPETWLSYLKRRARTVEELLETTVELCRAAKADTPLAPRLRDLEDEPG